MAVKAWHMFHDPRCVGGVWRRSFVGAFKWDSEHPLPHEGRCCDDPCGLPGFLRKECKNLRLHFTFMLFFNFLNFTQNGQWTHFSSPRSHECTTEASGSLTVLPCGSKLGRSAYGCVIGTLCIVRASELDEVTASIAHHHPELQATNPSDLDSRSAQVIAIHSFSPKSLLLYDEVLH